MAKRDLLEKAIATRETKTLTTAQRQDLGKAYTDTGFEKTLFLLKSTDVEWLNEVATRLKGSRRKTNKSELIRLGIHLLQQKPEDEVLELLRRFE